MVIGVAIWSSGDAFEETRKFIQKHGLTFPVVVDPERKSKVAAEYKVVAVPTNVIVGKDGLSDTIRRAFWRRGSGKHLTKFSKSERRKAGERNGVSDF